MEMWQDLDNGPDGTVREQEKALWQALEEGRHVPAPNLLRLLSGLLDEKLTRAGKAWRNLPPDVRHELVHSLAQAARDDYTLDFSALFRLGIENDDAEIRAVSAAGLEDVDDVRLVPAFIRMLQNDPSEGARAAAADALAKYVLLGELERILPTQFNNAVMALRDAYRSASEGPAVRSRALRAMGYTEEHGVPEMIAAAYKDADEALRVSAVVAMGRSANDRWGSTVRRELTSPIPDMRLEAARACGELELRAAANDLAELVDDVDERVRAAALRAMGQIGGKVAHQTLAKYGNVEDEALRVAADEALDELGFFSSDLSDFFAPPGGTTGDETEAVWHAPGLIHEDADEDMDDEDDWDADEDLDDDPDDDEDLDDDLDDDEDLA